MIQYIPKSVLVAEIEKLKGKISDGSSYCNGWQHALRMLQLSLGTLEVKEVDLEKHLKEDIEDVLFDLDGVAVKGATHYLTVEDVKDIAKHFFELGLKAQNKITPLQQQRISVLKMEFWTGLQTFEETEMTLSDAYNQGVDDILEELGLKVQKGENE